MTVSGKPTTSLFQRLRRSKLMRGAGLVAVGSMTASVLGLVAFSIAAKALGTAAFGILVAMRSYVSTVDMFVNFQSSKAVVKYGAEALANDDKPAFEQLLKLSLAVDCGTALVGAILGAAGAWLAGYLLGWSSSTTFYAACFSATILVNVVGVPTAILVLFDRFNLVALHAIVTGVVTLITVALCRVLDGNLYHYLLAWGIAQVLSRLFHVALGLYVLRQEGVTGWLRTSLKGVRQRFKGVWSFMITTNLHSSVKRSTGELDLLLIFALLGDSSAGIYKVAKQFSLLPNRLAGTLSVVIYPTFAHQIAKRQTAKFRKTLALACAMGLSIGAAFLVILWIGGDWIIEITVGTAFIATLPILMVYILGATVFVVNTFYNRALLSVGKPQAAFRALLISSAIYFAALYPACLWGNLMGAAINFVLLPVNLTLMYAWILRTALTPSDEPIS